MNTYDYLNNSTLYCHMREELNQLNEYHLFLQECGLLTEYIYFEMKPIEGISCTEADDSVGFENGYSL